MNSNKLEIRYDGKEVIVLDKWKVRVGTRIGQKGEMLFTYRQCGPSLEPMGDTMRYKCQQIGIIVVSLAKKEGDLILANDVVIEYTECLHNTIMKDLCADCGVNINAMDDNQRRRVTELTSVSMVHSIPELRVSKERAETLGRADERRLLNDRKLVLLVDLDQTLIHTTNHSIHSNVSSDVHHFQLYGPHTQWYHTKFRPHTMSFLESMSRLFELHICTFGARRYAHAIAHLLDPKEQYFPKDRILSRDECFDPNLKTGNMKSLFPCGDSMVCIIDDREDVWNFAPNLVAVKPYVCFRDTGDINAPEKTVPVVLDNQVMHIYDKTIALKEFTKVDEKIEQQIDEKRIQTKEMSNECIESQTNECLDQMNEKFVERIDKNEENDNKVDDKSMTKTDIEIDSTKNTEQIVGNELDSSDEIIDDKNKAIDSKDIIEDNDDYLLYLEEILTRIHSEYYKEFDEKMKYKSEGEEIMIPDLKVVIPKVRKCVLRGVNVVFSGVIPTNSPPEKNRLYNMAKQFGATITAEPVLSGSPKTTHLIASKWGTIKVNKCVKSKNIWIVDPNWMTTCAERWERVDERIYPLKKVFATESEKDCVIKTSDTNIDKCQVSRSTPEVPVVTTFATYDPKTGKRIRSQTQTEETFLEEKSEVKVNSSEKDANQQMLEKSRQIQPHNMVDFSPLSGFSMNELQRMGKEVDDACSEGDALSTGNTDSDIDIEDVRSDTKCEKRVIDSSTDDSNDSNDGECPKGWNANKRPKRLSRLPPELEEVNDSTRDSYDMESRRINDGDEDSSDNESIGSVDEEMALAVEREFLS